MFEEALRGFEAMLNLDFGTDWGTAAVNSFKNRNFLLGTLQEFNGMAEAALDLGIAYLGAALLGALESGLETALSTGSLTSGFLDGQNQFQNSVNSLKNNVSTSFKNFFSSVSNRQNIFKNSRNNISKPASTPVGRRGSPLEVSRGTNKPTVINGRNYTGHALDQMQSRGFLPSVVEDTIAHGVKNKGNTEGTWAFITNQAKVIVNSNGDVITVIPR